MSAKATHTPVRSIRVPDELWDKVQARASVEGTTASAVAVRAFVEYAGDGEMRGSTDDAG